MAITDFILCYPAAGAPADRLRSAALSVKSDVTGRNISISPAKAKPVRKAKHLAKSVSSCDWYEAEDRNLPSVSSF